MAQLEHSDKLDEYSNSHPAPPPPLPLFRYWYWVPGTTFFYWVPGTLPPPLYPRNAVLCGSPTGYDKALQEIQGINF